MRILGIERALTFSPNRSGADAAIFHETALALSALGHTVTTMREEEFVQALVPHHIEAVFTMARSQMALDKLQQIEREGVVVVNPPQGVLNCRRLPLTRILLAASLPTAPSLILTSLDNPLPPLTYPCWIKRGDSHAIEQEDVSYVTCREEALSLIASFKSRGISCAVVNEHLAGDLIKFYGVGTQLLCHYTPAPDAGKFGLEKYNGIAQGYSYSARHLGTIAARAASLLSLPVYGGDAIISPDGEIKLIDFNDWPGFSRCLPQAARAIAGYLHNHIKQNE